VEGADDGAEEGADEGAEVGAEEGASEGAEVGAVEGACDGTEVGEDVGAGTEGEWLGTEVGFWLMGVVVGAEEEGAPVGALVMVGMAVGPAEKPVTMTSTLCGHRGLVYCIS
jgi:hypothetical protein